MVDLPYIGAITAIWFGRKLALWCVADTSKVSIRPTIVDPKGLFSIKNPFHKRIFNATLNQFHCLYWCKSQWNKFGGSKTYPIRIHILIEFLDCHEVVLDTIFSSSLDLSCTKKERWKFSFSLLPPNQARNWHYMRLAFYLSGLCTC